MPSDLLDLYIEENNVDAARNFLHHSECVHIDRLFKAAKLGRDAIVHVFYIRTPYLFENIWRGKSVLCKAVKGNHLSTVNLILGFERCIDPVQYGPSPMIAAARNGNVAIIQALYSRFPKLLFKKDSHSHTPLNEAVEQGHVEATEFLVRLGSLDDHHLTTNPFTSAIRGGKHHMVPLLLRLGVPPHKMNSALHYACERPADNKMIELLSDQGSLAITDENNPIDILRCAQFNSADVIVTLVRLGYRCFMINSHSLTIIGNHSALAAISTLLPDYHPHLEKRHSRTEAWRGILLYLEDENFLRDTRHAAFFAEPLLLRCLREDQRRRCLVDQRVHFLTTRIRPRRTPL